MAKHKTRYIARDLLRQERLKQNWLARDFAQRVGISRNALSAIELTRNGVSERVGVEMAKILHVDFDELFETVRPHNADPALEEDELIYSR